MARKSMSLADQAYQTIKNKILDLTYAPGMSLTEAMLTEELGMSRSPVRAAIQMLQAEGLLVNDYYRSITVKEITDKDIQGHLPAPGVAGGRCLPPDFHIGPL